MCSLEFQETELNFIPFYSLDEILGEDIDFSCEGSLASLDIKEESEKITYKLYFDHNLKNKKSKSTNERKGYISLLPLEELKDFLQCRMAL